MKTLAAALASVVAVAVLPPLLTPASPRCVIEATDWNGDTWTVGEGDDLSAAQQGAVYPADWREMRYSDACYREG